MELILDDGKTVVCPECYAHLHVDKPVVEGQELLYGMITSTAPMRQEGQELLCHQCRLVIVIETVDGKLTPVARKDEQAEEDKTW